MSIDFVEIQLPTEVGLDCALCDREIEDDDEVYFVRVRDAAFVCKACREINPEKEPL